MNQPDDPLFTKPEPEQDEGDGSMSTLGEVALGLAFLAASVVVYLMWDSIALPEDSFAGGRRSGLRRLLGSIGQLPVTLIVAGIGVAVLALAFAGRRSRD